MLLNVVHAKGRIFVDVPVDIELPDNPSLQDLIAILPAAAAAARSSDPTGHFAGLEIAEGIRRDWIVEGRGANGQPWRREAWAVQPGEAALQAVVALLEETRAVRISDVPALVEVVRRLTVSAVLPEDSAPTP